MLPTVAGSELKCQDYRGRRGFEERQPVVVSGPWHNLSYKPDLAAAIGDIAKDPDKALKSLRKLIPGLSDTGTGSTTQGSGSPPSTMDAERMLKKLFGR